MKVKNYILRKIIRNLILESWSFSNDYSGYGNTYLTVDNTSDYNDGTILTKTHGFHSHAIKHANEFNSSIFNSTINTIKNYLESNMQNTVKWFSKNSRNSLNSISKFPKNQKWKNPIVSLLDDINDKIVIGQSITNEEQVIWELAKPIWDLYDSVEKSVKTSRAIDVSDVNFPDKEILRNFLLSLEGTEIYIHWEAKSSYKTFHVKFKPADSTYMSYNGDEVYTLLKILKSPSNQNVLRSLVSQAEIKKNSINAYCANDNYSNFKEICQDLYEEWSKKSAINNDK